MKHFQTVVEIKLFHLIELQRSMYIKFWYTKLMYVRMVRDRANFKFHQNSKNSLDILYRCL